MSTEWTVESQDPKEVEKQRRGNRVQRMLKCYEDARAVYDAWTFSEKRSGLAPNIHEIASAFFLAESLERMLGVSTARLQHETVKAMIKHVDENNDFSNNLQRGI